MRNAASDWESFQQPINCTKLSDKTRHMHWLFQEKYLYHLVGNIFASRGRKGPAVHERRSLELIVWLLDWLELTPLSLTEMARVVYCSVSPSTFRRRLPESNCWTVERPNAVELTDQHVRARLSRAMTHCHWRSMNLRKMLYFALINPKNYKMRITNKTLNLHGNRCGHLKKKD